MKNSRFKAFLFWILLILAGNFALGMFLDKQVPYLLAEQFPDSRLEKTMQRLGLKSDAKDGSNFDSKLTNSSVEMALKEILKPISIKKAPGGQKLWTLSKSNNLPTYLLDATQFLQEKKCKITKSQEVEPFNHKVLFSYVCPNEAEKFLVFEITNQYLENSSKVAVLFEVKGAIPPKLLARLDAMTRQYGLLINAFDVDSTLHTDLTRLQSPEVFLQLPLEDYEDMNLSPRTKSYLLHFYNKAADVEDRMKTAFKTIPSAQGFIPLGGRRALGNSEIRKAMLQFISTSDLSFLNNIPNQTLSLSQDCEANQTVCLEARNCIDTSKQTLEKCINDNFIKASKTSRNIVTLPLNESAFKLLDAALLNYKDKGIQLSNINDLTLNP